MDTTLILYSVKIYIRRIAGGMFCFLVGVDIVGLKSYCNVIIAMIPRWRELGH